MAAHRPTLERIVDRVCELVRIPSVNPLQAGPRSGVGGEQDLAAWLADRADGVGADVTVDEVLDGRSNVYARFAGTSDREVTIDVHMDTVGVEHMTRDPFDGVVERGMVFGRGSVDTKATLGVVLTVLEDLQSEADGLVPNVTLVGTVSEEVGGLLGASRYASWLSERAHMIDQLIVAEPTMCAPVFGHKGGVGLDITVHGHAAHSSKPHLGENAIGAAADVIVALHAEHDRLAAAGGTTRVGPGTLAVTEISGGRARNIIPDGCSVYGDRRIAPGEDPEAILAELTTLIEDAATPLRVDVVTPYGEGFPAFYEDPSGELITTFAQLGGAPPETASYGSNAVKYGDVAHEVMVFGPGSIDQAHKAVEWITIDELDRAAQIYRRFLTAD
jgi:acetylornithine deacetylase/succinyl-diaminopimelate desuccinylase-like protein